MICGSSTDNSYASDYSDLSVLKNIADELGIAILLIHHLRKENDNDPFNRISGTTGIQGVVDSSFILSEDVRGSGQAKLYCVGRDIEYREIFLKRNEENIWEVVSDSFQNKDVLLQIMTLSTLWKRVTNKQIQGKKVNCPCLGVSRGIGKTIPNADYNRNLGQV